MLRKDARSHEGNYVAKATVLGAAKCPSPLMSEGIGELKWACPLCSAQLAERKFMAAQSARARRMRCAHSFLAYPVTFPRYFPQKAIICALLSLFHDEKRL